MDGILIVAHGTKDGNRGVLDVASQVESLTGLRTVAGFKRFGEPKLREAMGSLVESGADRVAVVPLFLSEGKYVSSIPRNLGLRPGETSGTVEVHGRDVSIAVSGPVGREPGIGDAVISTVRSTGFPAEGTGVVLLGHGSADGLPGEDALRAHGYRVRSVTGPASKDMPSAVGDLVSQGAERIVAVQMRLASKLVPVPENMEFAVTGPIGTSRHAAELAARMAIGLLS